MADTITQRDRRDPTLKDITDFVEARARAANHPIFGKVSSDQKPVATSDRRTQRRTVKTFTTQGSDPKRPSSYSEEKTHPNAERKKPLAISMR